MSAARTRGAAGGRRVDPVNDIEGASASGAGDALVANDGRVGPLVRVSKADPSTWICHAGQQQVDAHTSSQRLSFQSRTNRVASDYSGSSAVRFSCPFGRRCTRSGRPHPRPGI